MSGIRAPPPRRPPPRQNAPPPRHPPPPKVFMHDVNFTTTRFDCPDVSETRNVTNGTHTYPVTFLKPSNCLIPPVNIFAGRPSEDFQERLRLLNGDSVRFSARLANSSSHRRRRLLEATVGIDVNSIQVTNQPAQKEIYTGSAIQLRSVTYLVNICGMRNPFQNPNDYLRYMTNTSTSTNDNIQLYYSTCSYNKVSWDPRYNKVVGPIDIPCSGVLVRGILSYPWTSTKCGAAEQAAWLDIAETKARNLSLTNPELAAVMSWTDRRRAVMILPGAVSCPWAGLGMTGCVGSRCTAFIKGLYASKMTVIYHELQHNMGLGHATRGRDEYGDNSDSMGDAVSVATNKMLCHNAAYMWRIGWAKPLNHLYDAYLNANFGDNSAGNLTAGDFNANNNLRGIRLPATSLSDSNFVRVSLGAVNTQPDGYRMTYPIYFISYRSKRLGARAYDSAMPSTLDRRVYVHNFNGSIWERDYNKTELVALGTNLINFASLYGTSNRSSWTSPYITPQGFGGSLVGGAIKLTVTNTQPDFAIINLCRLTSLRENDCENGIDDDCDGLVDDEDPDCV